MAETPGLYAKGILAKLEKQLKNAKTKVAEITTHLDALKQHELFK